MKCRAFTLIELLLALSLLCLLIGFASPSLQSLWTRHQRSRDLAQLMSALQYARLMSLSKHATLTVCPYTSGYQCGEDWTLGLMVTQDKTVLKIFPAFSRGSHLTWLGLAGSNLIRFRPNIIATNTNGHFEYAAPGQLDVKDLIVINRAGQISLAKAKPFSA